ncbi:hypothetical protein JTE90_027580 [Oedothorax gibbosus]|uniref:Uncharacterized protein n=1 Tax=Oedothorax gibbosus TaxID=931172 RepID=A0AAV6VLH3_9ARAC|nr:hypothetical protein JTE90_027580 [Oedothorax gibbosus]
MREHKPEGICGGRNMLKFNRFLADRSYQQSPTSQAGRNCNALMSRIGRTGVCFVDGQRIFFGDSLFLGNEAAVSAMEHVEFSCGNVFSETVLSKDSA